MPSTKRHFIALACGLVLSLCGTLTAANGQEKEKNHRSQVSTFPGTVGMMNPCPTADHGVFFVDGTNVARYRENKDHATIHIRFLAKGLDSIGQPVKAFLHANAQVDPGVGVYEIPFESIWVDKGSHNFEFLSNLQVTVVNGRVTSANIFPWDGYTLQCTDDTDANAADRRFNNDKDEDDKN
ncbi:MAG: hypothetical protein DMG64_01110 [Acidobacteria bacterium]|nr:MAG: hypothetical protein DMG64_01110 [Acidobacteriota bacterium]PYY22948.1 MAG: hypothetical protein DMG62_10705 [Acidobacteriota bacterium]